LQTTKKIILANIKGTVLDSLSDLLEMWGYTPIRIESAETIKAVLSDDNSALIIYQFLEFSDDEYKLLTSIRQQVPGIPVVATSPFISVRDTFRVVRAGVEDYLVQPYSPRDLRLLIERYLGASSATDLESPKLERFAFSQG